MFSLIKLGIIALLLTAIGWLSYKAGQDSLRADMAEAVRVATIKAREEEQVKQEKVNAIAQQQHSDLQTINAQLVNDVKRLHNRSNKRHLPKDNKTTCKSATGANLSRPDAEFLTREAARADTIRTALKACYAYADEISRPKK